MLFIEKLNAEFIEENRFRFFKRHLMLLEIRNGFGLIRFKLNHTYIVFIVRSKSSWAAGAKWTSGPAPDCQRGLSLGLSFSEGLGGSFGARMYRQTYCFFRTAGRPSPKAPESVFSSVRSSVSAKEGQPITTLGPSTLNIIFAFGSVLIKSGNSRLRQGPALLAAAGATYLHAPPASEIFTWIWSSRPVLGDLVVPIHWPDTVLAFCAWATELESRRVAVNFELRFK
jgi:hypothetical protein